MTLVSQNEVMVDVRYTPAGIDIADPNTIYGKVFSDIALGSKVLEFGCYAGDTGKALSENLSCEVHGVDIDSFALGLAESKGIYASLRKLDLNNFKASEFSETFDFILLTDVLEHLYEPAKLLSEAKSLLSPGGKFIISVPNIAHGVIKLKLMNNLFEYTKTGLLDSTHIRFFTLNNLLDLLVDQKLLVTKFDRIQSHFEDAGQNIEDHFFPQAIIDYVKDDKESYTYQFYVVCSDGAPLDQHHIANSNANLSKAVPDIGKRKPVKRYLMKRAARKLRRLFNF